MIEIKFAAVAAFGLFAVAFTVKVSPLTPDKIALLITPSTPSYVLLPVIPV